MYYFVTGGHVLGQLTRNKKEKKTEAEMRKMTKERSRERKREKYKKIKRSLESLLTFIGCAFMYRNVHRMYFSQY